MDVHFPPSKFLRFTKLQGILTYVFSLSIHLWIMKHPLKEEMEARYLSFKVNFLIINVVLCIPHAPSSSDYSIENIWVSRKRGRIYRILLFLIVRVSRWELGCLSSYWVYAKKYCHILCPGLALGELLLSIEEEERALRQRGMEKYLERERSRNCRSSRNIEKEEYKPLHTATKRPWEKLQYGMK